MSDQGRPSIYTKELADKICAQLAEGKSLRTICYADDMPNASTVHAWVLSDKEGFSKQYARARDIQAEVMFDEILEISDDGSNDYMTITKGKESYNVEDREVTNRSKLRVDSRKWYLSKVLPKKFGDKLDMTTNGKDLPTPILGYVSSNHSDKESNGDDETYPRDTGGNVGKQDSINGTVLNPPSAVGQDTNPNEHSVGILSASETRSDTGLSSDNADPQLL